MSRFSSHTAIASMTALALLLGAGGVMVDEAHGRGGRAGGGARAGGGNVNVNRNVNNNVNVNRNVNVHGGGYRGGYGYRPYRPVAAAAAVAGTALAVGAIVSTLPTSCHATTVNGVTYQECGNAWYQPRYSGTQVNYVVVNSPY